jgi:hypothetical protein
MRLVGFSTGALVLGEYLRGLEMLVGTSANAVELSALREPELPGLMGGLERLQLEQFQYVSVHAPSRLVALSEAAVVDALLPCLDRGWNIVLHPDVIRDASCWKPFGRLLCLENMDKRKATGRTPDELAVFAEQLPDASFCLDLAHARQVDSTFALARFIIGRFGAERVAQVHLSELDSKSHHAPLSMSMVAAVQEISHWIPEVPVILESRVTAGDVKEELRLAALCFAVQERRGVPDWNASSADAPHGI